jgi:hypothetical protein
VLLGEPLAEETRGLSILNFLRIAVTELKKDLRELWLKVIPRLIANLTEAEDDEKGNIKKFDLTSWQDLILKVKLCELDRLRHD